ncbi:CBS domain-containing protein [Kineobactrum salinum]|uniref:CBS domain-containing protein n=1 Tax=Kineobactrum salinum TaxID=2708301 RepID=A0A6C0U851_9GAMM|nr:CBS domain-containing protein [Kineobactrum salinum]QIB67207.1 CBS domain-containing protein [Kineobactrum salinum]
MNIKDIMSTDTQLVSRDTSVAAAAESMSRAGVGFLLVGDDDQLRGTLTDRDIVLRVVANHKNPEHTTVGEILTDQLLYCRTDQPVEEVARNMSQQQVRRMPVLNADKRLVGVVSIGDIAQHLTADLAGEVLQGVTAEFAAA